MKINHIIVKNVKEIIENLFLSIIFVYVRISFIKLIIILIVNLVITHVNHVKIQMIIVYHVIMIKIGIKMVTIVYVKKDIMMMV